MTTYLYAGTVQGVAAVKSTDSGSWTLESQGLGRWQVTEVQASPAKPGRVFAGTRGDGVWVSEDFGQTWSKPSYGRPGPGKVQSITIAPDDPDTLYVGGEPIGIWVTNDAGKNWTYLDSVWDVPEVKGIGYPVTFVEPHVRDISFDPDDSNTIYAALQVGFMIKSTDRGVTWSLMNEGFDADVHTIVPSPVNRDRVFLATGGHDNRQGKSPGRALFKSEDRGGSWTAIGMEFAQEYSVPLVMAPEDDSVLYSAIASGPPPQWKRPSGAQTALIRSRDAGSSWQQIDTGFPELATDFPFAIATDESAPGHVYIGTNAGCLYRTEDGGDSWEKLDVTLSEICDLKVVHA